MEWWLNLNKWIPSEAVGHIRLLCSPLLQRAMDARFSVAQWSALSPTEALDAIKRIVLQPKNRAAVWSKFFSDNQKENESVSAFFTRCAQDVVECEFQCPSCSSDLGDYLLLGKLIVGLSDTTLKREVYRACDSFTIDSLRMFCGAYEATKRIQATTSGSEFMYGAAAASSLHGGAAASSEDDVTDSLTTTAAAATARAQPPLQPARTTRPDRNFNNRANTKQCMNCGRHHVSRRNACPARNATCNYCNKFGHFEIVCLKKNPLLLDQKVSGTVVVSSHQQGTTTANSFS